MRNYYNFSTIIDGHHHNFDNPSSHPHLNLNFDNITFINSTFSNVCYGTVVIGVGVVLVVVGSVVVLHVHSCTGLDDVGCVLLHEHSSLKLLGSLLGLVVVLVNVHQQLGNRSHRQHIVLRLDDHLGQCMSIVLVVLESHHPWSQRSLRILVHELEFH